MVVGFAAFILVGYAICLVPARLCHRDIGSFRRTLWVGVGNRDNWLSGVRAAYLAFAWPSLVFALVWRTSQTRLELEELRTQMRAMARTES